MKKMYVTPEMEIFETELSSILAASGDEYSYGGPEGHEENPQAPGMMSLDDNMDDTSAE